MKEFAHKYRPYQKIDLPGREWPNNTINKAPLWCSVDLRDGNQALITPMNIEQKVELFKLLIKIGFKNIEVGFPSASSVEFDFIRRLVDDKLIPDDVTVQVLVQAREHLIAKTFESLKGIKHSIVHLYNSTSAAQRKIVFKKSQEEIIDLAIEGVELVKKYEALHDGKISLEYSPESFTGTELEFSAKICNAVTACWGISNERKVIINLPATVEMSTPNIYADQIEWMGRYLYNRENVLISTHTHNDRGTSVAATELGLLAGADRVEGTLLSNGERTGNVDIITLALNMHTQGLDAKLDFSDMNTVLDVVERCTDMKTHERHPYVGELVYTAFSGSHQDAIKKGLEYQRTKEDSFWEVPYLPIDPEDIGRNYEGIIRINSQSGKGGVAFLLEENYGYIIPKKMHPELGKIVQNVADINGRELEIDEISNIFKNTYFKSKEHLSLVNFTAQTNKDNTVSCELEYLLNGNTIKSKGCGNGPIDACKNAITKEYPHCFTLTDYSQHTHGIKSSADSISYIQIKTKDLIYFYGVGADTNISLASVKAIFSALNRAFK